MEKKDSKPHSQDPLPSKEKENRRFALKLVFVGIIGFSLIVGILKFRQAKKTTSQWVSEQYSFEEHKQLSQKRKPASPEQQSKARGPLIKLRGENRQFNEATRERNQIKFKKGEVTLGGSLDETSRTPYRLVESLVAVKANLRDQFSGDDILGEKGNYIFVSEKEAKGLSQLPVVYNKRTRTLGFLTGVLSIKFENQDVFQNRFSYFDSDVVERRAFAPIALSLVAVVSQREVPALTERLRSLKTFWEGVPGVSKVTIEIIEHEKTLK